MKSPVERAIKLGGGIGPVSRSLGVTYEAIRKWNASGRVPVKRVLALEALSGVSRSELCPEMYPSETIKRKAG